MAKAGKLELISNDKVYNSKSGIKSISFNKTIASLVGTFSFDVDGSFLTEGADVTVKIKVGSLLNITLNSKVVFTGYVEKIKGSQSVSGDGGEHTVTFSGREKTSDVIDTKVVEGKDYVLKGPALSTTTYISFFKEVLKDNGLSEIAISVDKNFPDLSTAVFKSGQSLQTQTGQSVFKVLDKYVTQLNALLVTDSKGDLLVTRESTDVSFFPNLQNQKANTLLARSNNILSSDFRIDETNLYSKYIIYSQLGDQTVAAATDFVDTKQTVNQFGEFEDASVLRVRTEVITTSAIPKELLNDYAKWVANTRKSKAFSYSCTVYDFTWNTLKTKNWEINSIVKLADVSCLTKGNLLIESVNYSQSIDGSFTTLSLVPLGAYTVSKFKNTVGASVSGTVASSTPAP